MLRFPLALTAWIGTALLLLPALAAAQVPEPSPATLKRMRAALERPASRLRPDVPAAEAPTFHVDVTMPFSATRSIEEPPFDPTWGLPSAGDLIAGGLGKIGSAVKGYKRHRSERRARKEVQDAMAAYCAVHTCP
jgi:hypothetical protein